MRKGHPTTRLFVGAAIALILGTLPIGRWVTPAHAAVGDLVGTVDVPATAQCSSGIGTSVAVVPGSMIARNNIPILLVVSCFTSGAAAQNSSLYFLDPATNPATLVTTITTTNTPEEGWGSLSLRGDKGDLLGCGSTTGAVHGVFSIDVSPYNATPDGTATLLFNAQPGDEICDGVTWDTGDNTVWQSPDVANTIYHFSATGTLLGSFPAPAGCPQSGLAIGGASLFASCDGNTTIYQLSKSDGSVVRSFPSGGRRTEDLECDPVSFASGHRDVIWSKDAFDNDLFAFEIPDGTCGLAGGPAITPPQCLDTDGNGNPDNDGDGLCDNWETAGVDSNTDGTVDLQLYDVNKDGVIQASERADLNHKDIYIEADYMAQHQPNAGAITDVVAAFAAAPVANPDGTTGIRLHIQTDESVTENANLAFEPCTGPASGGAADFDTIKNASFATAAERTAGVNVVNAKRFMTHYVLFAHNLLGLDGTSGCSELPGNDFVVSLGSWTAVGGHNVGTRDEQGGTLMHELGHGLNLRHGGGDDFNCKPNYLSVMSYSRQINNNPVPNRQLDYSRQALPTLNEGALSEPAGVGAPAGFQTAIGPAPARVVAANGPVDWNRDGDTTDTGVSANVNSIPALGCNGAGTVLVGQDDWNSLKYDFQNTTDFADGVHLSAVQVQEVTADEAHNLNPTALLNDLASKVANVGPGNSLTAKIQQAGKRLAANDVPGTCSMLNAFIAEVKAQSGKKIPAPLAASLTADTQAIKSLLGCA